MSTTTWSTVNKVGLGMQLVYGLVNIPSIGMDPGTGTKAGPPMSVLWADTLLGVLLVVAVVIAWRKVDRLYARLASTANVLISLTAVPAFFVDVPMWVKELVTVSIIWTVVSVVLTHRASKAV